MNVLTVYPTSSLEGDFYPSGAKNAALPILIASLIVPDSIFLNNIPHITDVMDVKSLLEHLNVEVVIDQQQWLLKNYNIQNATIPNVDTQKTRASVLLLGAMVALFEHVTVGYPGGCPIGDQEGHRPINLHLNALQKMGCTIEEDPHYLTIKRIKRLQGQVIHLDFPSVTATQNIIVMAVKAQGTTVIHNAAREPEVETLCHFLNQCGANIRGFGGECIQIEGVLNLRGNTQFTIIPDRIETGTFIAMVAAVGGNLHIHNARPDHLTQPLKLLSQMGVDIQTTSDSIKVQSQPQKLKSSSFVALPYPYFPTDLQAQWLIINLFAQGDCTIEDKVFPKRFGHVDSLNAMGANITIHQTKAHLSGPQKLRGTTVQASDLRASSSLVIAGLCAKDTPTVVENIHHLERGYENFIQKIKQLNGHIEKT